MNFNNMYIKLSFSHRFPGRNTPKWGLQLPTVDLELSRSLKIVTPANRYQQLYRDMVERKYSRTVRIFTDGSKTDTGVGSAALHLGQHRSSSLPTSASILSAEQFTLLGDTNGNVIGVFSDSTSSLLMIRNRYSVHPVVKQLQYDVHHLSSSGKVITFVWVPSHVGIDGNEIADEVAVAAGRRPAELISIHYEDWNPALLQKFIDKWNSTWSVSGNKLHEVKESVQR